MSTDNDFYCKIEIFCFSNVFLPGFIKEKCFKIKDNDYYSFREEYNVYTKSFCEYQPIIDCLNIINEQFNNINYQSLGTKQCESILIYNKWRKSPLYLSMYGNKWMLLHRSRLTNEWKENLDKFGREQETIVTRIPYYEEYEWCEFISKERVYLLVKDFLDRGDLYKLIGDFDERKYHEYLDDFWQSWIEDGESNQSEQTMESDDNSKNKIFDKNPNLDILEDNFEENNRDNTNDPDALGNENPTLSKEVDGQLNLFNLGLEQQK
jgi:hypothetical protein